MQRACGNGDVFRNPDDCLFYTTAIARAFQDAGIATLAYCILKSRVHFVLVPPRSDAIAYALRVVHAAHARHFNATTGLAGRVWQGRFCSCPLDSRHAPEAVRYVERLAVREGFVTHASAYPWSSAAWRCGKAEENGPLPLAPLPFSIGPPHAEWLMTEDASLVRGIERCTRTGRPCGDPAFVHELEARLGRAFAPKKRGRPPKTKTSLGADGPSRRDDWRVW
ncbi:MAG TPA: transposase [Candidatus Hydrogenedentes bacterium]|nr:transposase [Candidatus Hydrogenedentota bacterium]HOS02837.1 transposase [Candidatus Hydrogenedentota bacterium]